MSNKDAEALTEALEHPNCKITVLSLQESYNGENVTTAIAKALKHPNSKAKSASEEPMRSQRLLPLRGSYLFQLVGD